MIAVPAESDPMPLWILILQIPLGIISIMYLYWILPRFMRFVYLHLKGRGDTAEQMWREMKF